MVAIEEALHLEGEVLHDNVHFGRWLREGEEYLLLKCDYLFDTVHLTEEDNLLLLQILKKLFQLENLPEVTALGRHRRVICDHGKVLDSLLSCREHAPMSEYLVCDRLHG